MKASVIANIAEHNTSTAIREWASNIAKRRHDIHSAVHKITSDVCNDCPFRNNEPMGGCITTACPVHKMTDAVIGMTLKATDMSRRACALKDRWAVENYKRSVR